MPPQPPPLLRRRHHHRRPQGANSPAQPGACPPSGTHPSSLGTASRMRRRRCEQRGAAARERAWHPAAGAEAAGRQGGGPSRQLAVALLPSPEPPPPWLRDSRPRSPRRCRCCQHHRLHPVPARGESERYVRHIERRSTGARCYARVGRGRRSGRPCTRRRPRRQRRSRPPDPAGEWTGGGEAGGCSGGNGPSRKHSVLSRTHAPAGTPPAGPARSAPATGGPASAGRRRRCGVWCQRQ